MPRLAEQAGERRVARACPRKAAADAKCKHACTEARDSQKLRAHAFSEACSTCFGALQSHDKAARHNANPNRAARSGDSNFTWADESLSCAMALLASAHAGASRRSAAAWSVSANPLGADILRCKGQASLQKAAKQADPVFPCLRLSLCRTSWHQFCRSTSRPTW